MNELRPAWVEIDLDAMAHNLREIRRLIGPACKLFSVVKVLDISGVPEARIGDEVVFLGRQGDDTIDGPELAGALGLPMLELLPRLARMAPRRYLPMHD